MRRTGLMAAMAALVLAAWPAGAATLLAGNTDGRSIVVMDTVKQSIRTFIAAGSGGLVSPDDMTIGPDGRLYVSSGTQTGGAILRFDARTGAFIDTFATSASLRRPYGHAFGPDGKLYVASFRSDEILRYDGATGAFLDVFASGVGAANGLNGPNELLFGPDGALYVTTQGSVAAADGSVSFGLDSQILRYDTATGVGAVFVGQPVPLPESFGFVSFLGMAVGPDGLLWTSDFANGLRSYDFATGAPGRVISTNFTGTRPSNNFIGSLVFADDSLFVAGFDFAAGNLGTLLAYDAADPGSGFTPLFAGNPLLTRPIGLLAIAPVPLPAAGLLLGCALMMMAAVRRVSAARRVAIG